MKLVHLADLHLGYRAYHRTNQQGINIREADVARAFREALDRTVELAPELLLIAGDVFHTVRPSNAAIADAFRQLSRFHDESPETSVVVIAGNHDSPRAAETGNILRLFAEIPGITVVYQEPKRLAFPQFDAAVLCLPHNALISSDKPAIEPDPHVSVNILLAHGAHERLKLLTGFGAAPIRSDDINPDDWDYVGLGHYHIYEQLTPNMVYPGGIERTSLNIWAEARGPKGFVEFDLQAGRAIFHKLENPRPVIDLPPIKGRDLSAAALDEAIEAALAAVKGGIDGKIIRLRLFDVTRSMYRELDHTRMREHRTKALHLHVDVRAPQVVRHEGSGAPGQRLSLQEELVAFLKHRWRTDAENIDREALVELGLRYLLQAEEAEAIAGSE